MVELANNFMLSHFCHFICSFQCGCHANKLLLPLWCDIKCLKIWSWLLFLKNKKPPVWTDVSGAVQQGQQGDSSWADGHPEVQTWMLEHSGVCGCVVKSQPLPSTEFQKHLICEKSWAFSTITPPFVPKWSHWCFNLTNLFEVCTLPASLRLPPHCSRRVSARVYVEIRYFVYQKGMNLFPSNCFNMREKLPFPS